MSADASNEPPALRNDDIPVRAGEHRSSDDADADAVPLPPDFPDDGIPVRAGERPSAEEE
ncbi:hypothetical protein JIG36_25125 [Actinoplanes sp. LDG1-06]|uniref:Uncharacterized protein n=1 Tax=Paractinoplanes ovalisporus TaxID=2810368 RepID=A0ABS2AGD0_9ACTN|nr:hypothetical protein [Actinoplanes ovalisporus]MBM2618845.1 hypothetical protein [Actinoplanes ovalisporus]